MTNRRIRIKQDFTVKSSVAAGFPLTVRTGEIYDLGFGPSGMQIKYGNQANFPIASDEFVNIEFIT